MVNTLLATKYENFMAALTDSAQSSDYMPVALLPMPRTQAELWQLFDNRPVALTYMADRTIDPPNDYSNHIVLPTRGPDASGGYHVEEMYIYTREEQQPGDNGIFVWYRCGFGQPMWMVLEAIDRA